MLPWLLVVFIRVIFVYALEKRVFFSCFGFCEICSDYWRLINVTSPFSSLLEIESERKRERRVMREKEKVIRESRERQRVMEGMIRDRKRKT